MKKSAVLLVFMFFTLLVSAEDSQKQDIFYFFYSETCPHCHDAMPFIDLLEKEYPDIRFKRLEVSNNEVNLAIFNKKAKELDIKKSGVPTFVFNGKYIVGFKGEKSEKKIRKMFKNKKSPKKDSEKSQKPQN